MPTFLHDIFVVLVMNEIMDQLKRFSHEQEAVMNIVKEMKFRSTVNITLNGSVPSDAIRSSRSPDASVGSFQRKYPTVILENAFSQPGKKLGDIAQDYILGSDGNIKAMIGFDTEYKSESRKIFLSVWRSRWISNPEKVLEAVKDVNNEVTLISSSMKQRHLN